MTKTLKLAPGLALPLEVVSEATAIVATRGAGKSSTAAVLVEETTAAGVPTVVIDWTGVFWGLRSNAKGDGPGLGIYVLGGPHGDVPLEASAGRLIADLVVDSGHSFVLDLSDFTKGEMRRFCADFLERLYDRKARARTTLLLVIDEAHELAPQSPRGGFKGDAARLIGAMEQVVALGRSRGIGAVLITQRTQALNKAVLDLIETLLIMRMLSPRAVAAVRDWIMVKNEDDERGVLSSLPELPTGTAWIWSPLRGVLERIAVRRIRTFDSYATPKPGEVRVEPKARRELDLDALGEQMRSTVERAKADDPKQLRRRIGELERELKQRPTETQVETVTETVEIPVLGDDELARLASIVEDLAGVAGKLVATTNDVMSAIGKLKTRPAAPAPVQRPAPAPRASATPRPSPAPRARAEPAAVGDFQISASQQRILNALAMLDLIGIQHADKTQLAFFAGTKPTSGGYKNNLGALRNQAGLIEYPTPGTVSLTDTGHAVADSADAPSSVDELHGLVRTLIPAAQAAIVDALIGIYPQRITREDLAEEVGVPVTSGGFKNNLGRLRSLGLIDYPMSGYVAALPVLFLEAA